MIGAVLDQEGLAGFEVYLQERGCYTLTTIRNKVTMARALQEVFGSGLPLDEEEAVDRIRERWGTGTRRRSLSTTARDLIAFYRARGAVEARAG